jgi:hypothetical protein
MKPIPSHQSFLKKHSLSLTTLGVVALLIVLYSQSDPAGIEASHGGVGAI